MNVSKPNLLTQLKQKHVFEWFVVKCGSKNEHQKDMCKKY